CRQLGRLRVELALLAANGWARGGAAPSRQATPWPVGSVLLALTAGYVRWRLRTSNARRMSEKPRNSAKNPIQISSSSAREGNSCWETQKPSRISSTPAIMPSHQPGLISREEIEVIRSRLPRKMSSSPKIVASAQNASNGLANDQQAANRNRMAISTCAQRHL